MAHVLTRLDTGEIPDDKDEIRLFAVVKDERDRLPYFLDYYRGLGLGRFFIVDNNSTDGTREFLLDQNDCHVFWTNNSYAQANYGNEWAKAMLDLYGNGHWCMVADADELLVYPGCEKISLHEFCAFLDREGSETMFTFLLDMYPKGKLEDAKCVPGKPFLDICSWFDKDYKFVDRISLKFAEQFPKQEVLGGPRVRCFYDQQEQASYPRRYFNHAVERGIVALRKIGIPFPYIRMKATPLFKVPLVKWKKGNQYTASTHQMNKIPISDVSGAVLHFKFFSDFHDRALKAVREGEHAEGAIEYKRYLERMEGVGNLMYEGSNEYRSSEDLIRLGLIKTSPAYQQYMAEVAGRE